MVNPDIELHVGPKLKEFLRNVRSSDGGVSSVKVGIFKESTYDNGVPVAHIAARNEFGVPAQGNDRAAIPERPFFRRGLGAMQDDVIGELKKGIDPMRMVVDERTAQRVGLVAQDHIKRQIETSPTWAAENALLTLIGKEGDAPLQDSDKLKDSISFKVER